MESRLRRHFSRLNVRGAGSSPGVCTSHPEDVKQKRKLAATGDLAHIPCNRHAPAIRALIHRNRHVPMSAAVINAASPASLASYSFHLDCLNGENAW